jgi:hypothetical protein
MRSYVFVWLFMLMVLTTAQPQLGFAARQVGGQAFVEKGIRAEGVKIGIIDVGFLGADKNPALQWFFENGKVVWYHDYINPEFTPYAGPPGLDDAHGSEVLQLIGGYDPNKKITYGLATRATYYLARTDHPILESRLEEKLLIQALHDMIVMGVRLFNVSLGYTEDYTDKRENYHPGQIDGRSTWVTRSLDSLLAVHPQVLVIIAAGNDANTQWQTLSAPADSRQVLTVGATRRDRPEAIFYSSTGPTTLGYVKPEVACFATSGTSFSAPVITGLAACLLGLDSTLSPTRIKQLLIRSSSLYPHANNHSGYGIPSAYKLVALMQGESTHELITTKASKKFVISLPPDPTGQLTVYHKSDGWRVVKKETLRIKKATITVKKHPDATQSTIMSATEIWEVIWDQN